MKRILSLNMCFHNLCQVDKDVDKDMVNLALFGIKNDNFYLSFLFFSISLNFSQFISNSLKLQSYYTLNRFR